MSSLFDYPENVYNINLAAQNQLDERGAEYHKLRRSEQRLHRNRFNISVAPLLAAIALITTHNALKKDIIFQGGVDAMSVATSVLVLAGVYSARDRRLDSARRLAVDAVPIVEIHHLQNPPWMQEALSIPTDSAPSLTVKPPANIR